MARQIHKIPISNRITLAEIRKETHLSIARMYAYIYQQEGRYETQQVFKYKKTSSLWQPNLIS